jgi:hypothetical protein
MEKNENTTNSSIPKINNTCKLEVETKPSENKNTTNSSISKINNTCKPKVETKTRRK